MSSGLEKPNYTGILKDDGKHGVLTRARKMENAADLNSPFTLKKKQAAVQAGKSVKDKENEPEVQTNTKTKKKTKKSKK